MNMLLARFAIALSIAGAFFETTTAAASPAALPSVVANDNRRPAGTLVQNTLTLSLRAGVGSWQPEGPDGASLPIEAFGEVGSPLTVPAPLVRFVEGTQIVVSIRNDLETPLTVHGLCAREGGTCPAFEVAPAATRELRFASGRAGTYHYWASSMGAPVPYLEMAGAFVVDPLNAASEPDRIFVITEWTSLTPRELRQVITADDPTETFVGLAPRIAFTMNGLSWPATERLTYETGDRVRWRVINLSSQAHPFHLHGFYFDVDSVGNGVKDTVMDDAHRRRVVTQLMPSGGTMSLTWIPERAGNWLFHCHVMHHVSPERRLTESDGRAHHGDGMDVNGHANHAAHDASAGMAGMILGVTVRDRTATKADAIPASSVQAPRKLTLVIREARSTGSETARAGFVLSENGQPVPDAVTAPGPAVVLRRGEPVEITLVNQLREATSIHWHGLELDSYYDGVHGWSGAGARTAPMIDPGATFVVRLTPPRAGTFIYHTHLHDYRQLSSGLYGPLIVTEPGETFDPATDHVLVLGRRSGTSPTSSVLQDPESTLLNGERTPRLVWKAGVRHRLRLINITPDDIFNVSLQAADGPATWKPLTKDGAALPSAEAVQAPARLTIALGETYDFEYDAPAGRRNLWLEARTTAGKWQVQAPVLIK